MRVAITGANGFLGSHLVDAALAAGHEVTGVVRRPGEQTARPGVHWVHGDLGQPTSLRRAFADSDVVVANAALAPGRASAPPEAFVEANVRGARRQVEAAADAGVSRVVYISTVAVYRTRLGRRLDEGAERIDPQRRRFDWNQLTTDPRYATSKAAAEQAVWNAAVRRQVAVTALRPGPIYGERDHKMTARYMSMLRRPLCLAPTARVPHVYARDVADAALVAARRPATAGRAYNVTGDSVPVYTALRHLARAMHLRAPVPVPVPLAVRFDDRLARRDLDFTPRTVARGMASVADYLASTSGGVGAVRT